MKILKVFPRKTNHTPEDENCRFDVPGLFDVADKINISCCFTYDKDHAEYLAEQWQKIAPVELGGPAYGKPAGEFTPGQYVKEGIVFTSRGCKNRCGFCRAWKANPEIIELEIKPGYIIQDDNLLQCSEEHILKVFKMLQTRKEEIQFLGGFEAKHFTEKHCELLKTVNMKQVFFAYDSIEDFEPLQNAARLLWRAGFNPKAHKIRAYVLIGYNGDTVGEATNRLIDVLNLGIYPMAMKYKDEKGNENAEFNSLQKLWARPAFISSIEKQLKERKNFL